MKKIVVLMLVTLFIVSVTMVVAADNLAQKDVNVTVNVNQRAKINGLKGEVEWATDPDFLGKWGHNYYEFFRYGFEIAYNTPITLSLKATDFEGENYNLYDLGKVVSYGILDKSGQISANPYVSIISVTPGGQTDSIDLNRFASGNSGRQNLKLVGTWNRSNEDWVDIISDKYEDTITITIAAQ